MLQLQYSNLFRDICRQATCLTFPRAALVGSTVGLFNFSDTSAKHITQLDKTALEDSATANATAALQQMVRDDVQTPTAWRTQNTTARLQLQRWQT